MTLHTSLESAQRLSSLADQLKRAAEELMLFHSIQTYTKSDPEVKGTTRSGPTQPLSVQQAEEAVVEVAAQVQRLMSSPGKLLLQKAVDTQHLACLRWLCHFDIPASVPLKGAITYEELAKSRNVPVSQVRSIARMAMTLDFLQELQEGKVSHSSLSRPFALDSSLRDWVLFISEASASCALKSVEATERWGSTEAKNETAYNIAMNTDLPFFEYLAIDKNLTKQFAGYMKNLTKSPATSLSHVARGFDWASLGDGVVVDVGGSSGHASIAIAKEFPDVRFIVQDLPTTIEAAATDTSMLPSELASRISFTPHDFFKPQPVAGASVYFLRTIIHDWPKTEACQILGHIAKAMAPNNKSRLLIMNIVLPQPGTVAIADESLSRLRDVTMSQIFNAKERELSDWADLIEAVDYDLKIQSVHKPFGSSLSVIEIIKQAKEVASTTPMAATSRMDLLGSTYGQKRQFEPYPAMV